MDQLKLKMSFMEAYLEINKIPGRGFDITMGKGPSDLVSLSLDKHDAKIFSAFIDCFEYCPDCGQSLPGITEE